ncbi:MAG: hypothetical protein PHU46_05835 [Rhodocyclaceae bacterium]|nr:hypothetical protein [Rhodocyclaceae bacterium]
MPAHRARSILSGVIPGHGRFAQETVPDVAALTLDDSGMIWHCNRAGEALFKYRRPQLVWRHVSLLLPQFSDLELTLNGQPNPRLRFLCHIGHQFRAVTHNGERFAAELFLNLLDSNARAHLSLIVRPVEAGLPPGQPGMRHAP